MADLRLDRIAALARGTLVQGDPGLRVRDFGIDSRTIAPGGLFFGVVARRDGHDFVGEAASRGAAGAVISRDVPPTGEGFPGGGFALVRVSDTVTALQMLAREVLAERPRTVVGITGSVGKTTTKDFAAAFLATRYSVLKSEGNFNNHLGLALSLLRLEPGQDAAVLEMGMSAPGEIRKLTAIAPPDVAVITNVNPVHLEYLKTLEAVAAAKAEILEGLKPGGTAVLNGDDPSTARIARSWAGRKIIFGRTPGCDVRAERVKSLGYDGFDLEIAYGPGRHTVRFPFLAETAVMNLLAALGTALALELPWDSLQPALASLRPASKRGLAHHLARGIVLIDDSYNSNPRAVEAALRSCGRLPARRRIAVLGDMLELGERAAAFHEQAGESAAREGWDILAAIGPMSRHTAEGARRAGMGSGAVLEFATSGEAAPTVLALLGEGDLVLVKGSRGIRTEIVVDAILKADKET
jgi:UDP-N-acetylmuramoyl-tripeptide--D-alanyl-D-alanine ligase